MSFVIVTNFNKYLCKEINAENTLLQKNFKTQKLRHKKSIEMQEYGKIMHKNMIEINLP